MQGNQSKYVTIMKNEIPEAILFGHSFISNPFPVTLNKVMGWCAKIVNNN